MEIADKDLLQMYRWMVLDPRTLLPLDREAILHSVKKTGKVVIVHEAPMTGGIAGEIAALIADEAFYSLDAPIKRVGAPFTPVPASPILEKFYLPNAEKIVKVAKEILQ